MRKSTVMKKVASKAMAIVLAGVMVFGTSNVAYASSAESIFSGSKVIKENTIITSRHVTVSSTETHEILFHVNSVEKAGTAYVSRNKKGLIFWQVDKQFGGTCTEKGFYHMYFYNTGKGTYYYDLSAHNEKSANEYSGLIMTVNTVSIYFR